MDGYVLRKKSSFKMPGFFSSCKLDQDSIIQSLLLKVPPRKLDPWFVLWSFLLLRLLCISINLPSGFAWNTAVMSRLLLLAAWRISRIVSPSLIASLQPLGQRRNVASLSLSYWCSSFLWMFIFSIDVHLNWLNPFHFLILAEGLLVILVDCMIFLSPFLDVIRMSTACQHFFIAQLDSGILLQEVLKLK